jgi:MFS family permease
MSSRPCSSRSASSCIDDAGVAFLTGIPLALFYVTCGIPISWLADRSNRRNILSISLIVWSGFTALCGLSRKLLAVFARAHRRRHRRSRRHAALDGDRLGLLSAGPAPDGDDGARAGRADRRMARANMAGGVANMPMAGARRSLRSACPDCSSAWSCI